MKNVIIKDMHIMKLFAIALVLLFTSCNNDSELGEDPYGGGKQTFDVRFADLPPSPSQGKEGTAMTFRVYGTGPYQDRLKFLINGQEANIASFTDTTITVVLPKDVSTGGTRVVIDGQIFAGPLCKVMGKVDFDPLFNAGTGSDGFITSIRQLSNKNIVLGGAFKDYNGRGTGATINGLVAINGNGEFVRMSFGTGAKGGTITNIHELSDKSLLISGSIVEFDNNKLINNITRLSSSGSLMTKTVDVLNLTDDPAKNQMSVPTFNGGTIVPMMKSFVWKNTVTSLGAFPAYLSHYYLRSTVDDVVRDIFPVGGVARMDLNGALDSSFNIDRTPIVPTATKGFEGVLNDGAIQSDGKLLVVGRISRYNRETVSGNIVRLNLDGSRDVSFNTGSGANDGIGTITLTASGKIFVTGAFTNFNGISTPSLALLNHDGSVDESFKNLGFSGGVPAFVRMLSNGKILVAGSFRYYNNVLREGFCILNSDGSLAKDYNNTGKLEGTIMDALEGVNSSGQRTLTLVGAFTSFNGRSNLGSIMRLVIQD